MRDLRQDSLFWTMEVYERRQTRGNSQTPIKGKSKGQKGAAWTARQTQWSKGQTKTWTPSAKGKSKTKDKGKSKPTWPSP